MAGTYSSSNNGSLPITDRTKKRDVLEPLAKLHGQARVKSEFSLLPSVDPAE